MTLLYRTITLALALLATSTAVFAQDTALRVGDQRGNARAVMEASGVLNDVPYKLEWSEFANAAPLLEALSAGALDAGAVGDAPLTFAAAAGVKAKAIFATRYYGNAIIVAKSSTVTGIKDLVGKKVGLVRGSAGHALLLEALHREGLKDDAVSLAFLPPAEATLALRAGSVDAVSTWEPYVSFATLKSDARIVVDGKDYLTLSYLIASDRAIASKRASLQDFVKRSAKARQWGVDHPEEYAKVIADLVKIPSDVALSKQDREKHAPQFIDQSVVARQQATIDLYKSAGIITKDLRAQDLLDASFTPVQTQ